MSDEGGGGITCRISAAAAASAIGVSGGPVRTKKIVTNRSVFEFFVGRKLIVATLSWN